MCGKINPGDFEFINMLSDSIVVLKGNVIVDINSSALNMLGGAKHQYKSRLFDDCINCADKQLSDVADACRNSGQVQQAVIMGITKVEIPITLTLSKLSGDFEMLVLKPAKSCTAPRSCDMHHKSYSEKLEQMHHCEMWYKTLIDFLPDALFVTYNGEYMFANKAGAELLGVADPNALLGRAVIEHLDPKRHEIHNERRTKMLIEPQKLVVTEQRLINEKNEIKEVQIISAPLSCRGNNTVISLVRDITTMREAETSLRESEDKYEKLVELCPDGIFILDENRIMFANKSGVDILDAPGVEALIGRNFIEFAHPDFIKMINQRVQGIYEENVQEQCFIQNKLVSSMGVAKDIEVVNIDFEHKGKKLILNMVRDITERKKAEEDRKRLEEAIAHDMLKTEFFSNISHELKTPLNIILSALQLINSMHNSADACPYYDRYKNYLQMMKQNCHRLLRLINNLIDITRIDSGFYKMNYTNSDIIGLVEDIVNSIEIYTKSKGLNIIFNKVIDEQIIALDPDKIERVILNLLSNAIKFNRQGGFIEVSIAADISKVYISVKDTGIGIPEHMLNKIFERFNQVDDLFTRKVEGSGIGLSLVKALLIEHGGDIKVKSEVGKGSEFIIELPIRTVNKEKQFKDNRFKEQEKVERINIEFSDIYSL